MAGISRAYKRRNNMVANTGGPVLCLDAGSMISYPGSGTTWTDLSGNGNTGTLVNGPTFDSANGGSIVFDGVDDYVNISSTSAFNWGLGNWTIELWFYISSSYTTNNRYTTIFESTQIFVGTLRSGLTGIPGFFTIASGNAEFISSPYVLYTFGGYTYNCAGRWTHLSIIKNGGTTYCYLNGALYASKSSVAYTNQSNPGRIAIGLGGTYPLNGIIPKVSVYNRALSATEISTNFELLRGRYGI